jgi:hypothetical protein
MVRAPVAKLASLHTVLALAVRLDLNLHQIDNKEAHLNREFTDEERIYMRQLPAICTPTLLVASFDFAKRSTA